MFVLSLCRWSRREEQDFARVVSFFGVVYNRTQQVYVWDRFRQLANLGKKSDERLTTYYFDFRDMCQRVINGQKLRKGTAFSSYIIENWEWKPAMRLMVLGEVMKQSAVELCLCLLHAHSCNTTSRPGMSLTV